MANFGDSLKRQRELREISLREISDATKINIRYLEALEQNRFDVLPGGLFNKGFIRAYATYIGVDCEETVNSYLEELAARASGTADGTAPAPPGLHRPVSTPRRRVDGKDAGSNGRPIAITLASGPAPETTSPGASTHAAMVAPSTVPAKRGPTPEPPRRPGGVSEISAAVTHIEAAAPAASPSRTLSVILMLAGGVGALFLILSLVLKHPAPERARQTGLSDAAGGVPMTGPEEATTSNLLVGSQGEPPDHASSLPSSPAASGAAGGPAPAAGDPRGTAHQAPVKPEHPRALDPPPATLTKADEASGSPAARMMELQVEATSKTWVQLFCDGREAINWVMREGESESMQCQRAIQVSAADAAAVLLRVNGASCAALGDSGSRVHGYTIRIDDFRAICPPSGRGVDGNP